MTASTTFVPASGTRRAARGQLTDRGTPSPAPLILSRLSIPSPIASAALFEDPSHVAMLTTLQAFSAALGAPLDCRVIPASLARSGTVGRIGVPLAATAAMLGQKLVLGATIGSPALSPVSRLWRGLQRRADVHVDVRQFTTLAGSRADEAGNQRDVLLFSQRIVEGTPRRPRLSSGDADASAHEWSRAREAADLAYRLVASEQRKLLLVLPVGRSTDAQQFFADALTRQARLHRMPAPRMVKAGLLAALLSGESGSERWLVASVIPIHELSALAEEAVGDAGPWPVISIGRDATFLDMPAATAGDPLPMLLVLSTVLQRSGRSDLASSLLQAALLTALAVARMREELGGTLTVPLEAFMAGVRSNLGRVSSPSAFRDRRAAMREPAPVVSGLRLRIETALGAVALREAVAVALVPVGLEVASVRSSDGVVPRHGATFDVRVRSRLGEPPLGDHAALAMASVLSERLRCVSVEPWMPNVADRPRTRIAG